MINAIHALKQSPEFRPIDHIAAIEKDAWIEPGRVAGRQIIYHADFVAVFNQTIGQRRAEEARAASDEKFHWAGL